MKISKNGLTEKMLLETLNALPTSLREKLLIGYVNDLFVIKD